MEDVLEALLSARQRDSAAASVSSRMSQFSQAPTPLPSQVSVVVSKIEAEDVEPLLSAAARSERFRFLEILRTMFGGASETHALGQKQRFRLCEVVVELVDGGKLASSKEAAAAVQCVVGELDTLTLRQVAALIESVMAGLKTCGSRATAGAGGGTSGAYGYDGASLSLLPKLTMRISQGSFVNDDKRQVTGTDFRQQVLEKFTSLDWPEAIAVRIITMLREVSMPQKVGAVNSKLLV